MYIYMVDKRKQQLQQPCSWCRGGPKQTKKRRHTQQKTKPSHNRGHHQDDPIVLASREARRGPGRPNTFCRFAWVVMKKVEARGITFVHPFQRGDVSLLGRMERHFSNADLGNGLGIYERTNCSKPSSAPA